jgi:hypothetical protein
MAAGAVARALKHGTRGQRRVAGVLFVIFAIPFVWGAFAVMFSR